MKGKNKKQNLSLLLGIIILFTANSCTKTATEMIVGHWVIEWSDFGYWEADYYDSPDYNEFYDYYYYCQCVFLLNKQFIKDKSSKFRGLLALGILMI